MPPYRYVHAMLSRCYVSAIGCRAVLLLLLLLLQ
jgi:hypothetical protein